MADFFVLSNQNIVKNNIYVLIAFKKLINCKGSKWELTLMDRAVSLLTDVWYRTCRSRAWSQSMLSRVWNQDHTHAHTWPHKSKLVLLFSTSACNPFILVFSSFFLFSLLVADKYWMEKLSLCFPPAEGILKQNIWTLSMNFPVNVDLSIRFHSCFYAAV